MRKKVNINQVRKVNGYRLILLSLFACKSIVAYNPVYPNNFEPKKSSQAITFTENKGQVSDQNYKPRPDVLFGGNANGMVFHLRNDGISYQLNRVDTWKLEDTLLNPHHRMMPGENKKVPDQISIYRVDINWLNCNKNFTLQQDESLSGYANYYHEVCPNGVHEVKTYKGVTYRNIYNNIDLHYYEKEGSLKYDYIVSPHTDYKQIQLQIQGAEIISFQKDGSVLIKTPLGEISEGVPIAFQNGQKLSAKWVIKNNVLSFEIENYNPNLQLLIDPVTRVWGTFYGGSNGDVGRVCVNDPAGNVFLTGTSAVATTTAIATSGSYQSTISGSGDSFFAKFNSAGIRQWGTYYGGALSESINDACTDRLGNVYICGSTTSTSGISTSGSHQPTNSWGMDAFLAKFTTAGIIIWATYYGHPNRTDGGLSCVTDTSGNVYMAGNSEIFVGASAITTSGSFQQNPTPNPPPGGFYDSYLVKFSPNGIRQWGTYYGSGNARCATDGNGNVYLAGATSLNSTLIATQAVHQSTLGGGGDAFIAKFSSAGVRQWGTYAGGAGNELLLGVAADSAGNTVIVGETTTNSGTMIASAGCHQISYGGGADDGFIAKFNPSGNRLWGTYYGGTSNDVSTCRPAIDRSGNIYVTGFTYPSTNQIFGTPGTHQPTPGGGTDGFLVKFSSVGSRIWGTYFGGADDEVIYGLSLDFQGNIYISGSAESQSGTLIATPGSHQPIYGGSTLDAFLVKFSECSNPLPPVNNTPLNNLVLCYPGTTSLFATGTGSVLWYASPTSSASVGSGSVYIFSPPSTGIFTLFAENVTCAPSLTRTAVTVTVNPSPIITVNSGAICSGQSFTINAAGATTYTVSGGNFIVSPASSTIYSVTGTSAAGCNSSTAAISSVTVHPLPQIVAVSDPSVICMGDSVVIFSSGGVSYLWSNGVKTFSMLVAPTTSTSYTVIGTDANGCEGTAIVTQSVSECVGLTQIKKTQSFVRIFPNPNTGQFVLELSKKSQVIIYNTLGQIIFTDRLKAGKSIVDLGEVSAGVYFIVADEAQIKMIKE